MATKKAVQTRRGKRKPKLARPATPRAIERAYAKDLLALVTACRKPIGLAVARITKSLEAAADEQARADADFSGVTLRRDNAEPVTRAVAGIKVQLDTVVKKTKPGLLAQGVGKRTTAFAVAATDKVMRGVVEIPASTIVKGVDQAAFVRDNVALIKSIPQQLFAQVEAEISEAWSIGRDTRVLARRIEQRFGVAESRAKLIARDQVAKLNGEVAAKRQQDLGVVEFTWSTSRDERVRGRPDGLYPNADPSHWEREGKVFRFDDPPEDGLPGFAINCRCVSIPIVPDVDE